MTSIVSYLPPNPQTLLTHEKNSKQDKSRKTSQISDQMSSNNVKGMRNKAKQMETLEQTREQRQATHNVVSWSENQEGIKSSKTSSLEIRAE